MPSPDDFREEAARALPPPHEQEPASLRADIVNELADHLACAYRRELLRTQGDAGQSLKNVHARFGNPRAIARKLWFDAMKGRLMAQRLMVAATLASALFIGLLAFAGWRYLEANQQMTSALIEKTQETNAALLAQTAKNQAALLARLEALPTAPAKAESLEWRSISLQFVDEQTGAPRRDLSVTVAGPTVRSEHSQQFEDLVPDENGRIELSPVYIGTYSVAAAVLDGAILKDILQVRPGNDARQTIRVPNQAVGALNLQVAWPDELKQREAWCVIGAVQDSNRIVDEKLWKQEYAHFFAVHTDGRVVDMNHYYFKGKPRSENRLDTSDLSNDLTSIHYMPPFASPQTEQGLKTLSRGRIAPYLCGLLLQNELPETSEELARELWAIRFDLPKDHSLELMPNGTLPDSPYALFVLNTIVGSQNPNSATTHRILSPGWAVITPGKTTFWRFTIPPELMAQIPADQLPPIAPVEARRPGQISPFDPFHPPSKGGFGSVPTYIDPRSADVPSGANSTPLTVKCLTETGSKPLPGVIVEIGIPTSSRIFFSQERYVTDADGQADLGEIPSKSYLLRVTLPWGEMKTLASPLLQGDATSQKRVVSVPCPDNPPAREKHAYQIKWPTQEKLDDHSPWLVMEVRANYERRVDSTKWISSEGYILAIHPDGLARAWKIQANQSGQSLSAMLRSMRVSGQIDSAWESLRAFLSPTEITPYLSPDFIKGSQFRVMGYGLARWDGSGDPISLLQGIQDGRYQHRRGSLFHDLLRTQVSMKSYKGILSIPQHPPASSEKSPTFSFEIPKDLYQSALRRAVSVAEVGGAKK